MIQLKEGDVYKNRFLILNKLGSGSFGSVYAMYDKKHDEKCTIKFIKIDSNSNKYVFQEVKNLEILSKSKCNEHILCLRSFYIRKFRNERYLIIITDYADNMQELTDLDLTTDDIKIFLKISIDILKTIIYIHNLDIVHNDIKLSNILISKDSHNILFIDFGLSCRLNELCYIGGTKYYSSDEKYNVKLKDNILDKSNFKILKKSEVYAIGKVLYEIFINMIEYSPDYDITLEDYIKKNFNDGFSKIFKVIKKMTSENFNERIDANTAYNYFKNILESEYRESVPELEFNLSNLNLDIKSELPNQNLESTWIDRIVDILAETICDFDEIDEINECLEDEIENLDFYQTIPLNIRDNIKQKSIEILKSLNT